MFFVKKNVEKQNQLAGCWENTGISFLIQIPENENKQVDRVISHCNINEDAHVYNTDTANN